jgi:hypothetical protein
MSLVKLLGWTVGVSILFILLSPGVLLTIPPSGDGVVTFMKTSYLPVVVHALVFGAVYFGVKMLMRKLMSKKGTKGKKERFDTTSTLDSSVDSVDNVDNVEHLDNVDNVDNVDTVDSVDN